MLQKAAYGPLRSSRLSVADLASGQLPNYFFIVPDDTHSPSGMTICITAYPGAAASAPDMKEFFQ